MEASATVTNVCELFLLPHSAKQRILASRFYSCSQARECPCVFLYNLSERWARIKYSPATTRKRLLQIGRAPMHFKKENNIKWLGRFSALITRCYLLWPSDDCFTRKRSTSTCPKSCPRLCDRNCAEPQDPVTFYSVIFCFTPWSSTWLHSTALAAQALFENLTFVRITLIS